MELSSEPVTGVAHPANQTTPVSMVNAVFAAQPVNAKGLYAELFARCVQAKGQAFSLTRVLGEYHRCFHRTADGWEMDSCSDFQTIDAVTAQICALQREFPALTVTFPQQVFADQRLEESRQVAWVGTRATAQIDVPEAFSAAHGGWAFRSVLLQDWRPTLERLADAVCKRLKKHEIRSAELFDASGCSHQMSLTVQATQISSAVWTLPLQKVGLYPLQWDNEICGMAVALEECLEPLLRPHCGTTLRGIVRHGIASAQTCAIDWTWADDPCGKGGGNET